MGQYFFKSVEQGEKNKEVLSVFLWFSSVCQTVGMTGPSFLFITASVSPVFFSF